MDWQTVYHRERKATWEDISDAIRSTVTMDDVLSAYTPQLVRRNNRCPCPIHNGKDANFSYASRGYKCFVCGASGDVISFVKEVCELPKRTDAMKRINQDFRLGLPIGCTLSDIQSANLALRRAAAEKKKAEKDTWWSEYHLLTDEWIRLDRIRRTADPNSDEYAEAVKNIDRIGDMIDNLPKEPG